MDLILVLIFTTIILWVVLSLVIHKIKAKWQKRFFDIHPHAAPENTNILKDSLIPWQTGIYRREFQKHRNHLKQAQTTGDASRAKVEKGMLVHLQSLINHLQQPEKQK